MTQKKKFQVFISSTFDDLKEERQAAVEAVLTAGHIPAGMELFAAGDESQMIVIQRWIDESDVYLLILGGRYGSIEPISHKSYIHLEYEYAVQQGKPVFAVVINEDHIEERVKKFGIKAIETENPQQLKEFRTLVLTKMSKFWSNPLEIKLAILETMADFSHRNNLIGWIPGSEAVNGGALAEELARLTKENAGLREELSRSSTSSSGPYNGLTYDQMYLLLNKTQLDTSSLSGDQLGALNDIVRAFGATRPTALHLLWMFSRAFQRRPHISYSEKKLGLVFAFQELGLVIGTESPIGGAYYEFTPMAKDFLLRLKLDPEADAAGQYVLQKF
jgi:hypothetical protein